MLASEMHDEISTKENYHLGNISLLPQELVAN